MIKSEKSIALVILSTDSLSDSWPIFFSNFRKFWPGFSGNKYLISDTLSYNEQDIISLNPDKIKYNSHMDWGGNLLSCLSKIPEEDLLLFLEDFILVKNINEKEYAKAVDFYYKEKIDFLSIGTHDCKRKGEFDLKSDFCPVKKYTKYRITTSPGLWKKSCLKKYIVEGLNPWQFEILGTYISMFKSDRFYMLNKNIFNLNFEILPYYIENGLDSAIVRGKWQKGIIKHVDYEYINSLEKRGFYTLATIRKLDTFKKVFDRPFFILKYFATVLFR